MSRQTFFGMSTQEKCNYWLSRMLPDPKLNVYNLIMMLGAFQGFLLSVLLYFKNHRDRHANRFLIVLLITFSVHLIHQVCFDTGFFNRYPFLHIIPYSYLYVIGPAVYLYARALLSPSFSFTTRCVLHFLPSLYMLPLLALYYGVLKAGPAEYKQYFFTTVHIIENYLAPLLMLVYLVATYRMLMRYHRLIVGKQNEIPAQLQWLLRVVGTLTIGIAFWKLYFLVNEHLFDRPLQLADYYPLYLMLAVLIYWLGFHGFLQSVPLQVIPGVLAQTIGEEKGTMALVTSSGTSAIAFQVDKPVDFVPVSEALHRVGLTDEQAAKVLMHLDMQMHTHHYYRQQNLTLESFARQVGIAPRVISAVVNTKLRQNFSDFINSYRIEEVIRRLKNKEYMHLTLIGIALESGFSSKTSFNRAFKETTGKTPKDFKSIL